MAKLRRAAKGGKAKARARVPSVSPLEIFLDRSYDPNDESSPLAGIPDEVLDEFFGPPSSPAAPEVPRVRDTNTNEMIRLEEFAARYPDIWETIGRAVSERRIPCRLEDVLEALNVSMSGTEALRAFLHRCPPQISWQEQKALVQEHGDRAAIGYAIAEDASWHELLRELSGIVRWFSAIVTPETPRWQSDAVFLVRTAALRLMHGFVVQDREDGAPYPLEVQREAAALGQAARRFVSLVRERGGMFSVVEEGFGWPGLLDTWDRGGLARALLKTVEEERNRKDNERREALGLDLATSLVLQLERLAVHNLPDEEIKQATEKLRAWLLLNGATATDEKIASMAVSFVGLDPKVIFAATRRKEQRTRQALRDEEKPPSKSKP